MTQEQAAPQTTEQKLTEERLAGFIAHLHAAVLYEDENRRILFANQQFCMIFPKSETAEQLIGSSSDVSLDACLSAFRDRDQFRRRYQQILTLREKVVGEPLETRDGLKLERDYIPIFYDGIYRGHYWIYRDVTYHHQIRLALEESRNRALALAKVKSQFLAHMSHEIRTPLHGLMGLTDLLQDTGLNPEQNRLLQNVRICASSLLDLLHELLEFSKLEAGRISLKISRVSLQSLVDHCRFIFEAPLTSKGLNLRITIDPRLPSHIFTDPSRVRQVLVNLVSNAIKFTDRGEVAIRVEAEGPSLVFAIEDTGIGMDADDLTQIFSPYVQAKSNQTGQGTGLGLAICRDLAHALGGDITVTSTLGKGSCFRFTLRLEAAAPGSGMAEQSAALGSNRLVLLVEDNPINQEIARGILKKMGLSVQLASSGEEALHMVQGTPYSLVLMDCQLPGIDGYETTRRIRQLSIPQPIIVALTANTQDDDKTRCLDAGMNAYMPKPVSREAVSDVLLNLGLLLTDMKKGQKPESGS